MLCVPLQRHAPLAPCCSQSSTVRLRFLAGYPLARDFQIPTYCSYDGDLTTPLEPNNYKIILVGMY